MYIKRDITDSVLAGAKDSPVVSVIGPRQSGKSTLCRHIFPKHNYVDMQEPDVLQFALSDPKGFLRANTNEHGIIIDEAQYAPILFDQIKVEVDKDRHKMGKYILSGSQNFLLIEKITESLAGRVYIYKLLPLSIKELKDNNFLLDSSESQIVKGFYPNLYTYAQLVEKFYESYFYTYVERDIRSLRNIENLSTFKKFIQLCIARIGQPLNISSLASEAGITTVTAKAWLSILEASFILFLMPSFHNNLSKRAVKSPKIYFYDVGLAANIAGLSLEFLKTRREILGQFFENMIIVDLIKECNNRDIQNQFSFFRDTNLKEVDLIIETPGVKTLVEIKASMTIQSQFFDNLNWLKEELKLENNGALIYAGDQSQKRTHNSVFSWNNCYKVIDLI